MSVNQVFLLGNLGHSPKLSYTAGGIAVSQFSMATSRKYTGTDGQIHQDTEWHQVVAYGRQAEVIHEYVQRGNRLWVEGHLRTRKYIGKDKIERSITEVIVDSCQFFNDRAKEADR